MLFSVVIPTHERRHLLPRTLDSVWAQTFTDFEVIVADDGSTDGTKDWLDVQRESVRVLEQPNRGPGAARNLGASVARGDYIAFLDSDDVWFPWTLQTFATLIPKYELPTILGGNLVEFRDERELDAIPQGAIRADAFADYFSSAGTGYFVGSGMAVLRRDALLASGGFILERVNAEDHDLILRLGTASGFVQVLSPVTLGWRRHSASETNDQCRSFEGTLRMLEQERRGMYPGGTARKRQRRDILTGHARPASLAALRSGIIRQGWRFYRETFLWHIGEGRWPYLVAFPILALVSALRGS